MELDTLHFDKQKPQLQNLVTETKLERRSADRNPEGDAFSSGAITFKLSEGNQIVNSDLCRLNMRMSLTKGDGVTPLQVADGISWCMNPISTLFSRIDLLCNDVVINSVTNNVSQIDTVRLRQNKSASWLDSTGRTIFMEPSLSDRIDRVSSDGKVIQRKYVSLESLGYSDADAVGYIATTGIITFTGKTDVFQKFQVGDLIIVRNGGVRQSAVVEAVADETVAVAPGVFGGIDLVGTVGGFDIFKLGKNDSQRISKYEFISHVPMAVFNAGHSWPAGNYSLRLFPQNENIWKKMCVESLRDVVAGVDYDVKVEKMYFMSHVSLLSKKIPDGKYYLTHEEMACSTNNIVSEGGENGTYFNVSPNSHALTVAFQDNQAQTGGAKSSPTKLVFGNEGELGLTRLYISYANRSVPSYLYSPDYDPNVDYTTLLWNDTYTNSGLIESVGGCEKQDDWQERGTMTRFNFYKSPSDMSSRATVYYQFKTGSGSTDQNVLLFSHYLVQTEYHVQDGQVVACHSCPVLE